MQNRRAALKQTVLGEWMGEGSTAAGHLGNT